MSTFTLWFGTLWSDWPEVRIYFLRPDWPEVQDLLPANFSSFSLKIHGQLFFCVALMFLSLIVNCYQLYNYILSAIPASLNSSVPWVWATLVFNWTGSTTYTLRWVCFRAGPVVYWYPEVGLFSGLTGSIMIDTLRWVCFRVTPVVWWLIPWGGFVFGLHRQYDWYPEVGLFSGLTGSMTDTLRWVCFRVTPVVWWLIPWGGFVFGLHRQYDWYPEVGLFSGLTGSMTDTLRWVCFRVTPVVWWLIPWGGFVFGLHRQYDWYPEVGLFSGYTGSMIDTLRWYH